jgi:hypothetical protein
MESFWWTLQSVLPWLLTGGFSFEYFFLRKKKRRKEEAELTLTTVDAWRQIAESNSKALLERNQIIIEQNEKILSLELAVQELNGNIRRLETILSRIAVCEHYSRCPVRRQLQDFKRNLDAVRKHPNSRKIEGDTAPGTGSTVGTKSTAVGCDEPAGGRGVCGDDRTKQSDTEV